jgi:isoleucyl-tRNA synthetase
MELANRVGVDAMRFYLLSSPIVRGEDLNFSEMEVLEQQRKNLGRLHNVLAMYEMYQDGTAARNDSSHVLDRWMIARLNETVRDITEGYEGYELDRATRPLETLIDDLSVWYLRRSRERLKGEDVEDKQATRATLRHVLKTTALLMAPVMPFYAEYLFQKVREEGDGESVHLMLWPKGGEVDDACIAYMKSTRLIVTLALEARQKSNIKVRQPVASVSGPDIPTEYQVLVLDEINAKTYTMLTTSTETGIVVRLDTIITPELKIEGEVRELMRAIQDARKEIGLMPHDRIVLALDDVTKILVDPMEAAVLRTVGASAVVTDLAKADRTLTVNESTYRFGVSKS